jgi:glycine cleavage system H protein
MDLEKLKEFKFSKEHEWVKVEGDIAAIGISDHAQHELGDVVYVELPAVGDTFKKGDALGNIESVKAVSDIYTPLSGKVTAVNGELEDQPEIVNQDPYGKGWIVKLKMEDTAELDDLMNHDEYQKMIEAEQ